MGGKRLTLVLMTTIVPHIWSLIIMLLQQLVYINIFHLFCIARMIELLVSYLVFFPFLFLTESKLFMSTSLPSTALYGG